MNHDKDQSHGSRSYSGAFGFGIGLNLAYVITEAGFGIAVNSTASLLMRATISVMCWGLR